ncbi:pentatricopeptide repeat-containing protein At4g38150-like [Rosa rugosa]|uniref:pentatricopeptide repeat-containing protein At4g38150-like n=1 Tax=Rosa rugosa TaxID=74645 RepID=UPI002B405908|nr:pentatricopeptide repeat-containing protein At4g38150-like [Rosa rugosa]
MVAIYTSIIKAHLNAGKTKGALEAYRGMLAAGVAPNSYTYTVLIKGLTTDPNFFEDAKKCLLEMMDKGKRPNVATYTAVIEAFARQEDKAAEEEGKDLVWVMMSKGFVPNAKAMREVLKECTANKCNKKGHEYCTFQVERLMLCLISVTPAASGLGGLIYARASEDRKS